MSDEDQTTAFLEHYGVKGMKWGVRKDLKQTISMKDKPKKREFKSGKSGSGSGSSKNAQNATVGPANLGTSGNQTSGTSRNNQTISITNQHTKSGRKNISKNRRKISDKSLKDSIDRLQSEKKLKDLISADVSPGKKILGEILGDAGKRAATTMMAGAMLYGTKALMEGKFDLKTAAGYVAPKPGKK